MRQLLYTATEAAKLIGVSRQWVHQMVLKGKIKKAKVKGNSLLIPHSEVIEYKNKKST